MQNRYVGDVGDFGKFGLLRFLCSFTDADCPEPRYRLGVVWYLYHDPKEEVRDGRHIEYLQRTPTDDKSEFRDCDPPLWEGLRDLVLRDARYVHSLQLANLLPEDTLYFDSLLCYPARIKGQARNDLRAGWLSDARKKVRDADVVFLDPDNGLIPPSKKIHHKDGPKYTAVSEMKAFWDDGKSLILYQSGVMDKKAKAMIADKSQEIKDGLEIERDPVSLWFGRRTGRVFFVIPHPDHREVIEDRVRRITAGPWGAHGHFERA